MGAALQLVQTPLECTPLDRLAGMNHRLANVVEAISRRRDVRRLRAKLLVLILETRCPRGVKPRRAWYVPGAAARLSASGLRRAWRSHWAEEPPAERTLRAHLGALESGGALVRQPGDWLPARFDPDNPEKRPRYPDTIHVLDTDEDAAWWAEVGHPLLEQHPEARRSARAWAGTIGDWRARLAGRAESTPRQLDLFVDAVADGIGKPRRGGEVQEAAERRDGALQAAEALRDGIATETDPLALLELAAAVGARIEGDRQFEVAQSPARLRGALARLAMALARGDRIRNRAGWLFRVWKHASGAELGGSILTVRSLRAGGDL